MPGDLTHGAVASTRDKLGKDAARIQAGISAATVLAGVDGYVDSLYSLVARRDDVDHFNTMASMKELAAKITEVAGSSCNVERVLKKHIGGGFGPNIARCLGSLGAPVDLVGCLGAPDGIFTSNLPATVRCHSLGPPGATCALEFTDGKVMLTDFGPVNDVSWDLVCKAIGRDQLVAMMNRARAIGQGHWALVPRLHEIWDAWIKDVFPSMQCKGKVFFVDPADMSKRSRADVGRMLGQLASIEAAGFTVVLSANDKEAIQLAAAIEGARPISAFQDYYTAGQDMVDRAGIHAVVIHSPHFATFSTRTGTVHVKEGFTRNPRFTTAAGDHFNGGLLAALVSGAFDTGEALVIANACTACFVRTGVSPDLQTIARFASRYMDYVDGDIDVLA